MSFASDNTSGVAPEILAALAAVNEGVAPGYGADAVTERLGARFRELFETEVAAFPVATGTAANALGLACVVPPWGAVYCHRDAHIAVDECGAPEFFAGGAKLVPLPGDHGRLDPATLEAAIGGAGNVHQVQPAALSLTQASEAGTLYRPEEVAALAEVARRHGLAVQMDGARFANAVAALGCSPAEITWRAGVDILAFGATKNGALAAEAVVFFKPEQARDFAFRRKRGGHLFSKMRFLSAQLEAYLEDDLWLRNARRANAMARRLADGLAALPGVALVHPVEANEVFARLPAAAIDSLLAEGFGLYRWGPAGDDGGQVVRLVTAFNTAEDRVEAFLAVAARLIGARSERAAAGA